MMVQCGGTVSGMVCGIRHHTCDVQKQDRSAQENDVMPSAWTNDLNDTL